jgi:hypothetical protein
MRKPLDLRRYTDKELVALLPTLPFEQQVEEVIRKYVGGIIEDAHNGEHNAAEASAIIARGLVGRLKRAGVLPAQRWKP